MSLQAKISNDTSSLPLDDKANLLAKAVHIFVLRSSKDSFLKLRQVQVQATGQELERYVTLVKYVKIMQQPNLEQMSPTI